MEIMTQLRDSIKGVIIKLVSTFRNNFIVDHESPTIVSFWTKGINDGLIIL